MTLTFGKSNSHLFFITTLSKFTLLWNELTANDEKEK